MANERIPRDRSADPACSPEPASGDAGPKARPPKRPTAPGGYRSPAADATRRLLWLLIVLTAVLTVFAMRGALADTAGAPGSTPDSASWSGAAVASGLAATSAEADAEAESASEAVSADAAPLSAAAGDDRLDDDQADGQAADGQADTGQADDEQADSGQADDEQADSGQADDEQALNARFAATLRAMVSGNLRERRDEAERMADSGHPRAGRVLNALLEGRLFFDARAKVPDEPIVLKGGEFEPDRVEDAITGDVLLPDAADGLRAVPVNNPLRNLLRDLAALADLDHPSASRRALAAQRLMSGSLGSDVIARLDERLEDETHPRVLAQIERVRALARTFNDDAEERLAAIEVLVGEVATPVRNRLARLADSDDDARVQAAAAEAFAATERRVAFYRQLENLFFGLSLGSVLLLAALGLAITFGVMGVINMAHGELIMIGAYTTWFLQTLMPGHITTALLLAIPAAFLVSGLVGVAMERGVIRFLYGRPLETLLATFGISLILQQAVRSIFSPLNQAVASPAWLSGSVALNPVLSLTMNRLVILFFAVAVFLALVLLLKRSTLGLKVRAVTQNREMARSLGVRASWVDAMTFGLGAGIAGVAGVALAQLTNVGPNMGQSYIIDSFMVVVFGGVGNLWGTFVGAMGLGVLTKVLEPGTGAVLAKVLVLVFIILFIQSRPRGLFPQKGRAAEA